MRDGYHSYGLVIEGLPALPGLTGTRQQPWRPAQVRRTVGAVSTSTNFKFRDGGLSLHSAGRLSIVVRRHELFGAAHGVSATVTALDPVSDDELRHPCLAIIAGAAARWSGRTAFHGAAVVLHGRSWVLTGPPGSGKSTLAAAFDRRGYPVQSDDLAVVSDGVVFGGPRSTDLRSESARHFEPGELVRRGDERRWRTLLGPAPHEAPYGGIVELHWGADLRVEQVPLVDRLSVLARAEGFGKGPSEPESFLRLLGSPVLALRRPRGWQHLDDVVDRLHEVTSAC